MLFNHLKLHKWPFREFCIINNYIAVNILRNPYKQGVCNDLIL